MMDVLLYVALGLIILYIFLRRDTGRYKTLPGPSGWPLIGSAASVEPGTEHEVFSNMAEKYGDIFRLTSFGQTIIVLNSAQLIRTAFTGDKYKKYLNDRPDSFSAKYFYFGSQGMSFVRKGFGSELEYIRKSFARGMHVYGEGKQTFEDNVRFELTNFMDRIQNFQGEEFDMLGILERSLSNIMSLFLSGHVLKDDDEDVNMLLDFIEADDYVYSSGVNLVLTTFPFLRHVPGMYKMQLTKMQKGKDTLLRRYFFEKKASYEPGKIRGIVDFLLAKQLDAQDNGGDDVVFTDEEIQAFIMDITAAGIATSVSSLSSLFLCLINYPEYQVKIQSELDQVVGRDRLPALTDRHACVFTEAVFLEAQRYITVVPFALPHFCEEGIEFEGFKIPPTSMIYPNVWFVHHDRQVWGDPWNFRPGRWLDESGSLLPNDHMLRKNWMPFGNGRRQCPGESLARSRIFLYVATLLQRWSIEMLPEHTVSCDPRLGHFNFELACRPKPYMCRAVPRSTEVAGN